jgi:hypothetical protein
MLCCCDLRCVCDRQQASTTDRELDEFKKEFAILTAVQSDHLVKFYGVQLRPALTLVMEL